MTSQKKACPVCRKKAGYRRIIAMQVENEHEPGGGVEHARVLSQTPEKLAFCRQCGAEVTSCLKD